MSSPGRAELRQLEELLPWYLNGSLEAVDRQRVEAGLRASAELRARLEDVVAAMELATQRPASGRLVALAAGELEGDELRSVEAWLQDRPEDEELVAMARVALAGVSLFEDPATGVLGEAAPSVLAEPAPSVRVSDPIVAPFPGVERLARWRLVAVAASLVAAVALFGWWRVLQGVGEGEARLTEVTVIELLPDDLVLRGEAVEPTPIGGQGPVALVLVVEGTGSGVELAVSLRNAEDREMARIEGLTVSPAGSVSLLLSPDRLGDVDTLVLLRVDGGAEEAELHRYTLAESPSAQ